MENIFDYLRWRGDLSFAQDYFNEIDNLILSVLSYQRLDWIEELVSNSRPMLMSEIAGRYQEQVNRSASDSTSFQKQVPKLFIAAALSHRFRSVTLSNYVSELNPVEPKQFAAVAFSLDDRQHFIAYRGTDGTIAGWKEDFQMSFMNEVPAQKRAVLYLNGVSTRLQGRFYLGGHSKGGNLAVYAAAKAARNARDMIAGVYNNDGPGFLTRFIDSAEYQNIIGKIKTFVPQSSVIGLLLDRSGDYKIVRSFAKMIWQHDAFSWQVNGSHFAYGQCITNDSLGMNRAVRAWLSQVTTEQRSQFVDALFEIFEATGAKTFHELSGNGLSAAILLANRYKHLDPKMRTHLKKTIRLFFQNAIRTNLQSLRSRMNSV